MNIRKRLFAFMLAFTMVLTYMPALAFAAEGDPQLVPMEIWAECEYGQSLEFDGNMDDAVLESVTSSNDLIEAQPDKEYNIIDLWASGTGNSTITAKYTLNGRSVTTSAVITAVPFPQFANVTLDGSELDFDSAKNYHHIYGYEGTTPKLKYDVADGWTMTNGYYYMEGGSDEFDGYTSLSDEQVDNACGSGLTMNFPSDYQAIRMFFDFENEKGQNIMHSVQLHRNESDYPDYPDYPDDPEDPSMVPESMYFSSAADLMAVAGDSFINGNTLYMDGNLIEIIFKDGYKGKYNCISFPYVNEDGEETEYTGYFRDGNQDGDEIVVDCNVEGGFKLGDNEVTLTAYLNEREVSTTVHVKGVESEDDIYNALKDDAEQSSADAAAAAESDDLSADTDAVISGAVSVTDAAVKAAESAVEAAKTAIDEAGDDAEAKAEAEAQLKAAEELKAATTQYKATARMASATVATKKAAAAKKAAASAAATPGQAAVNAAVASKAAADEAAAKAEKAKEAADDAVVAARTVYDNCTQEEQSAAWEALDAATQAAAAADKALENANKAAEEAADAVTDAQNKKAQKDAADAQAAAAAAAQAAQAQAAADAARQGTLNTKLPKVSIKKPAAAKKAVTVKWKKLSKKNQKKAGKIEVWVCPNKAFAAADTVMKETGKKKASIKIKGLAKKKTYYVKVRSIQYVGGVKNVGKWSKVKTVKTK